MDGVDRWHRCKRWERLRLPCPFSSFAQHPEEADRELEEEDAVEVPIDSRVPRKPGLDSLFAVEKADPGVPDPIVQAEAIVAAMEVVSEPAFEPVIRQVVGGSRAPGVPTFTPPDPSYGSTFPGVSEPDSKGGLAVPDITGPLLGLVFAVAALVFTVALPKGVRAGLAAAEVLVPLLPQPIGPGQVEAAVTESFAERQLPRDEPDSGFIAERLDTSRQSEVLPKKTQAPRGRNFLVDVSQRFVQGPTSEFEDE